MDIVYVSAQCSERLLSRLFEGNKYIPGQQAQKFNRLFAEGFAMQDNVRVFHISQVPAYNHSISGLLRTFHKEKINGIEYHYLPVLNIHKLQDILNLINSFFLTLSICIKHSDIVVVTDILVAPSAFGAVCAANLCKKKTIGIVTDVPDVFFEKGKDRAYHVFSNKVIKKSDGYVLLTRQMNDIINPRKKPYIVIEGMVDIKSETGNDKIPSKNSGNNKNRKIILYTGTINKLYGIQNLVEGFMDADLQNAELHIYGDGDYREELGEICQQYPNIKYYGIILNEKIPAIQQRAFLLVNPRSDEGEYTKYSFPSKNMEYMASGRPVLLKVLPGMPDEYREYVFELDEADKEDICEKLRMINVKGVEELQQMGENARTFVIKHKNNKRQAAKLIKWILDEGFLTI